jgi:hypothetical protein
LLVANGQYDFGQQADKFAFSNFPTSWLRQLTVRKRSRDPTLVLVGLDLSSGPLRSAARGGGAGVLILFALPTSIT